MRNLFMAMIVVFGCAAAASAQTQATPGSKVGFDVADVATVAEANASIYKLYVDALAPATLSHTCIAGTPISCTAPAPAMTPGAHSLTVSRSQLVNNVLTESPKSSALSIQMLMLAAPQNLRIVAG